MVGLVWLLFGSVVGEGDDSGVGFVFPDVERPFANKAEGCEFLERGKGLMFLSSKRPWRFRETDDTKREATSWI